MSSTEHAGERRCGSCGHLAAPDDDFCTRCGTDLDDATNVLHLGVTPPLPSSAVPVPLPEGPSDRSRRLPWVALAIAVAVLSVACVALAVATITSRQDLSDTRSELETSQAQVTALKKSRAALAAELAATRDLSRRRAAVLLRANRVLKGVDPLLSSVDEVKQSSGKVQSTGDSFVAATDALIDTTIELVNYLVETDPESIDNTRVNDLIDEANGQLVKIDSYRSQLQVSRSRYKKVAATFDTRASSFSSAVEALKQQLEQVTR